MLLNSFIRVETLNSTPVDVFHHKDNLNFESFYIIPEYAFAVELNQEKITLSSEHVFFCCYSYEDAHNILKYDSNKVVLYELNKKIRLDLI